MKMLCDENKKKHNTQQPPPVGVSIFLGLLSIIGYYLRPKSQTKNKREQKSKRNEISDFFVPCLDPHNNYFIH